MNKIRLVNIKTWENMEAEFGLNIADNIDCKAVFTIEMDGRLPIHRWILTSYDTVHNVYRWNYGFSTYTISSDMIEEEFKIDTTREAEITINSPSLASLVVKYLRKLDVSYSVDGSNKITVRPSSEF